MNGDSLKVEMLQSLLGIYRKLWANAPEDYRDHQLAAMRCWSPRDFELFTADLAWQSKEEEAP